MAVPAGRPGRDTVKILADFDAGGHARKITTFADGLNIPIGVVPVRGGAVAFSIPNVYRLIDSNGDDKVDQREVLYGPFGQKDTHGLNNGFTRGFDGWIYACHGFANESTIKGRDGAAITMVSGNTYRMKADGARIEYHTHGQVNPFGQCLDPLGYVYTADCHTRPAYQLVRGAWYPSFGRPDDGLGFGPELMTHDHGSTAIAGIVYYAADHFPPKYRDTLYIGNVVTNRINHDTLERHGSTFKAVQQPDFLVSDDPWFRPVDIKLGPDGALYIADFYNRIIGHYEVPLTHPGRDRDRGRIWRIVWRGDKEQVPPTMPRSDWTKASVDDLISDLGHPNLTVRLTATHELVDRGPVVVPAVSRALTSAVPWTQVHALWVLQRLSSLDDAALVATASAEAPSTRVHAQRILAERREMSASLKALALAGLKDANADVRRVAAEVLAVHPAPEQLRPLLDLRHAIPADDTHLLHAVRIALRNQLTLPATWKQLPLTPWSEADARAVADVAVGVATPEAAAHLLHFVRTVQANPAERMRFLRHIARYGNDNTLKELFVFARALHKDDLKVEAALVKTLRQGLQERGTGFPDDARRWALDVANRLLASPNNDLILAGIDLVGSGRMESLQFLLVIIAMRRDAPEPQRLAAVTALVGLNASATVPLLGRLLDNASETLDFRVTLAAALGNINQPDAHAELLRQLTTAPERLARVLATGLAGSPDGADKLVSAVESGQASPRLLVDQNVHRRLSLHLRRADRLAQLTKGLPPPDQKLQELMKQRRAGFSASKSDPAQGARVFEKTCAACHQIANKGARIGPQLDGVGARGVDRLLEDVLDPNRNVDQAFRATVITLKNGQLVTGLVLREEGAVVILADLQGKEVRVDKSAIDERTVSPLSPMPANFGEQITEVDLYHLLAYLAAQRVGK
jgi:putative heme-binding domain-containing protein